MFRRESQRKVQQTVWKFGNITEASKLLIRSSTWKLVNLSNIAYFLHVLCFLDPFDITLSYSWIKTSSSVRVFFHKKFCAHFPFPHWTSTSRGTQLSRHYFGRFQASATKLTRTILSCVIRQRVVVISYRCFATTYRFHLQGSRIQLLTLDYWGR